MKNSHHLLNTYFVPSSILSAFHFHLLTHPFTYSFNKRWLITAWKPGTEQAFVDTGK